MSDLLSIGASGVAAYRTALQAIGDNVANAETPGFARREVRMREPRTAVGGIPGLNSDPGFRGVEIASIDRSWDQFRAADARFASSAEGHADVRQRWLTSVETALDDGEAGVGQLLGRFFAAATTLSADPGNSLARSNLLTALDSVTSAFRATATTLARTADNIAVQGQNEVDRLNADLEALVGVNDALAKSIPGSAARATIEDSRDEILDSIAERVDIRVDIDKFGRATVSLGQVSNVTLLEPTRREVVSMSTASDGRITLSISQGGTPVPLPASGGILAGLVDVSASTADKRNSLDALAQDFATQINSWSAAGRKPDGTAGGNLLQASAGAASLQLLTSIPADIAAADSSGSANGNLAALTALRGTDGVEARWAAMVSGNAQALNAARYEADAALSRKDDALTARDTLTGVDLDREAAELMRFQQAYNGASKILQVARETVQAILAIF